MALLFSMAHMAGPQGVKNACPGAAASRERQAQGFRRRVDTAQRWKWSDAVGNAIREQPVPVALKVWQVMQKMRVPETPLSPAYAEQRMDTL